MLHRFLASIQACDVQSLLEFAHKLDISPDMVFKMAKELTDKDYPQEIGPNCDEPQPGCSDYSVNRACQSFVKHRFLTEKGRSVVSSRSLAGESIKRFPHACAIIICL